MESAPPPSTGFLRRQVTALQALCVHAEGVVAGARVAVVCDSRLDLPARLVELGARGVHVFDPAAERARAAQLNAPRAVAYHALTGGALDVRDGAFDVVLVPDLSILSGAEAVARELARVLSDEGVALVLTRAQVDAEEPIDHELLPELGPARTSYDALYDAFSLQFSEVTISGVLPFRGVVFAELGRDDDDGVSVDGRLAEGEPTNVFLVVASGARPELPSYSLVQLPLDEGASDLAAQRAAFAEERLRAQLLASRLEEEKARARAFEARLAEPRVPAPAPERDEERRALASRCAALEEALSERQRDLDRFAEAVSRLETARAELAQRVDAQEAALLERDDEIATLRAHLDARDARPQADPAELAELARRAERAETALALHAQDLEHFSEAHVREVNALEAQLRERARLIGALEQELVRRERLARELISTLEDARAAQGPHLAARGPSVDEEVLREETQRLARKLDALAADAARREGELVAHAWRVAELERELARAHISVAPAGNGAPHAPEADVPPDLASARKELDALRQALTQEHEARVAAESGESLSRARAQLQRQAALLEQLRRSREP